ncbi:hypothetical protein FHR98_002819 [Limibacillus halophilus]|uniref:Uncharacterized protein n=1 Tax=Limibacillus halophilus TaxID=1579333 RepID=A0A839SUP3_9PROT|nr:hypothetical protein [Limibacillus halophilus]
MFSAGYLGVGLSETHRGPQICRKYSPSLSRLFETVGAVREITLSKVGRFRSVQP